MFTRVFILYAKNGCRNIWLTLVRSRFPAKDHAWFHRTPYVICCSSKAARFLARCRQHISPSYEMALRLGQPPAFGANEARLGARVVHQAIVLGPVEEALCQRRALIEALSGQARRCGAKVDDWKLRRRDQTIEVPQTFGLQAVDEEEFGHALVGRLMGWTHVENALEAPPGARKVFREPSVFGIVHPLRAVIR